LAYYISAAALVPYLPIYFKDNGLPASSIGILTSLNPIVSIIGGPLAGLAADRTGRPRLILGVLVVVSSLLRLSLAVIVGAASDANDVFGIIFVAVLIGELFAAPINALIDNAALQHIAALGLNGDEHYGKQRLWGAVGWGCAAVVVGTIVENSSNDWKFSGTDLCFILFAACELVTVFVVRAMPMNPSHVAKVRIRTHAARQAQMSQSLLIMQPSSPASIRFATHASTSSLSPTATTVTEMLPNSSSMNSSASSDSLHDVELSVDDNNSQSANESPPNNHDESRELLAKHESISTATTAPTSTTTTTTSNPTTLAVATEINDDDAKEVAVDENGRPLSFCGSLRRALGVIFTNGEALKFFCIVICMGIVYGLISGYLFLYLQTLGASTTLMGLSLTVTCIAEVPVFHYSGKMIDKLGNDICRIQQHLFHCV
jgi:hypothetical protein